MAFNFLENICNWLASIGKSWRVLQSDAHPFAIIEVSSDQVTILHLQLIDLENWIGLDAGEREALILAIRKSRDLQLRTTEVIIWEDLWTTRTDIVKSRICALLGISQRIPGRVTQIRRIDKQTAVGFLDANHLQGAVSSRIQYGLYLPERYYRLLTSDFKKELPSTELLVAVATFSHPRTFLREGNLHKSFEMIRFANLISSTVVGGLAKLIQAFIGDFHPGDIMTYADLEWSGGASYTKLGFTAVSETAPIRFWLDPVTMVRYSERQASLLEIADGIPVYNMGSRKFVKVLV